MEKKKKIVRKALTLQSVSDTTDSKLKSSSKKLESERKLNMDFLTKSLIASERFVYPFFLINLSNWFNNSGSNETPTLSTVIVATPRGYCATVI